MFLSRLAKVFFGAVVLAALFSEFGEAKPMNDQAVIIYLKLSDNEFGAEGESFALYDVEDDLEKALGRYGELDGHEIGGGFFTVYTYGPDADAMLHAMLPVLTRKTLRPGSYVVVRKGPPGSASQTLELPIKAGQ